VTLSTAAAQRRINSARWSGHSAAQLAGSQMPGGARWKTKELLRRAVANTRESGIN